MQVLYDAASLQGLPAFLVASAISAGVCCVTLYVLLRSMDKPGSRKIISACVPLFLIGAFALFVFARDDVMAVTQWHEERAGQYEVVQGCVTNFSETSVPGFHVDQNTFSLAGRAYKVNGSGVGVGYEKTRTHGGLISNGKRLRVWENRGVMLKIELLDGNC